MFLKLSRIHAQWGFVPGMASSWRRLAMPLLLGSVLVLSACSKQESGASAGAKSCKLESEKIAYLSDGRKKMCTYRCEDGTLEGRTRKPEQECLSTVNSADG